MQLITANAGEPVHHARTSRLAEECRSITETDPGGWCRNHHGQISRSTRPSHRDLDHGSTHPLNLRMTFSPSSRVQTLERHRGRSTQLKKGAAILLLLQQEKTMFEHETLDTASDILTDEQIELVAGGYDGTGNIPICPPRFPGRPGGGPGPIHVGVPVLK